MTFKTFANCFVGLLLLVQLWSNVEYCLFAMMEVEIEVVETEKESESEEEKKKNKHNKYRNAQEKSRIVLDYSKNKNWHDEEFKSLHHPEITTPPPEYYSLIS